MIKNKKNRQWRSNKVIQMDIYLVWGGLVVDGLALRPLEQV
jgi:hypothetical protein